MLCQGEKAPAGWELSEGTLWVIMEGSKDGSNQGEGQKAPGLHNPEAETAAHHPNSHLEFSLRPGASELASDHKS